MAGVPLEGGEFGPARVLFEGRTWDVKWVTLGPGTHFSNAIVVTLKKVLSLSLSLPPPLSLSLLLLSVCLQLTLLLTLPGSCQSAQGSTTR